MSVPSPEPVDKSVIQCPTCNTTPCARICGGRSRIACDCAAELADECPRATEAARILLAHRDEARAEAFANLRRALAAEAIATRAAEHVDNAGRSDTFGPLASATSSWRGGPTPHGGPPPALRRGSVTGVGVDHGPRGVEGATEPLPIGRGCAAPRCDRPPRDGEIWCAIHAPAEPLRVRCRARCGYKLGTVDWCTEPCKRPSGHSYPGSSCLCATHEAEHIANLGPDAEVASLRGSTERLTERAATLEKERDEARRELAAAQRHAIELVEDLRALQETASSLTNERDAALSGEHGEHTRADVAERERDEARAESAANLRRALAAEAEAGRLAWDVTRARVDAAQARQQPTSWRAGPTPHGTPSPPFAPIATKPRRVEPLGTHPGSFEPIAIGVAPAEGVVLDETVRLEFREPTPHDVVRGWSEPVDHGPRGIEGATEPTRARCFARCGTPVGADAPRNPHTCWEPCKRPKGHGGPSCLCATHEAERLANLGPDAEVRNLTKERDELRAETRKLRDLLDDERRTLAAARKRATELVEDRHEWADAAKEREKERDAARADAERLRLGHAEVRKQNEHLERCYRNAAETSARLMQGIEAATRLLESVHRTPSTDVHPEPGRPNT